MADYFQQGLPAQQSSSWTPISPAQSGQPSITTSSGWAAYAAQNQPTTSGWAAYAAAPQAPATSTFQPREPAVTSSAKFVPRPPVAPVAPMVVVQPVVQPVVEAIAPPSQPAVPVATTSTPTLYTTRGPGNQPSPLDNLTLAPYRDQIMDAISKYYIVDIIFNTGTGKSVGVPAWVASAQRVCWCTGPTHVSVWGLARRQTELQTIAHGGRLPPDYVGSAANRDIKYVSRTQAAGVAPSMIVYMTEQHLVNLLYRECYRDGVPLDFTQCDVLCVDEVHDGSVGMTMILSIFNDLVRAGRIVPRLVRMTATPVNIPMELRDNQPIHVVRGQVWQHRIYDPIYLAKDLSPKKMIEATAQLAAEQHKMRPLSDGHFLIFVASKAEITTVMDLIAKLVVARANEMKLLPAHGSLSAEDLQMVHDIYPEKRKIIVATNVAESSVTIEGVGVVIDTMRMRVAGKSATGGQTLTTESEPQTSAMQRMGRTGRTQEGWVYRMCTKEFYDKLDKNLEPEIFRIALYELFLTLYGNNLPPKRMLPMLDNETIEETERELIRLGALQQDVDRMRITNAGRFMSLFQMGTRPSTFVWSFINGFTVHNDKPIFATNIAAQTFGAASANTYTYDYSNFYPSQQPPLTLAQLAALDMALTRAVQPQTVGSVLDMFSGDGDILSRIVSIYQAAKVTAIEERFQHRPTLFHNVDIMARIVGRRTVNVTAYENTPTEVLDNMGPYQLVVVNGLQPYPLRLSKDMQSSDGVRDLGWLVGSLIGRGITNRVIMIVFNSMLDTITTTATTRAAGQLEMRDPIPVTDTVSLLLFYPTNTTRALRTQLHGSNVMRELSQGFDPYTAVVVASLIETAPHHYIAGLQFGETKEAYRKRVTEVKEGQMASFLEADDLSSSLKLFSLFQQEFGPTALKLDYRRRDQREIAELRERVGEISFIDGRRFGDWCKKLSLNKTKFRELLACIRTGLEALRLHLRRVSRDQPPENVLALRNKYEPRLGTLRNRGEITRITSLFMHDICAPSIVTLTPGGNYRTPSGGFCITPTEGLNKFFLTKPPRLIILNSVISNSTTIISYAIPDIMISGQTQVEEIVETTRTPLPIAVANNRTATRVVGGSKVLTVNWNPALLLDYQRLLTVRRLQQIITGRLLASDSLLTTRLDEITSWLERLANLTMEDDDPILGSARMLQVPLSSMVKMETATMTTEAVTLLNRYTRREFDTPWLSIPPVVRSTGTTSYIGVGNERMPLESAQIDYLLTVGSIEQLLSVMLRYELLPPSTTVPVALIKLLVENYRVVAEALASPLDSRIRRADPNLTFASLFLDTDAHYGSVGSFFQQGLAGGTFWVNPPTPLIDPVLERIYLTLITAGADSLFYVLLPSNYDIDLPPLLGPYVKHTTHIPGERAGIVDVRTGRVVQPAIGRVIFCLTTRELGYDPADFATGVLTAFTAPVGIERPSASRPGPRPTALNSRSAPMGYSIKPWQLLAAHNDLTDVGASAAAVEDLMKLAEAGTLTYPFRSQFSASTNTLFANLRGLDVSRLFNRNAYTLSSYYPTGRAARPEFRRSPLTIITRESDELDINVLTDHYTEAQRIQARHGAHMTPYELWYNLDNRRAFFRELIDRRLPVITPRTLHEYILRRQPTPLQQRTLGYLPEVAEATNFRLTWAYALLVAVRGLKLAGQRWLDISAGWGDRLAVAAALKMVYEAWDPNTSLKAGHTALIADFGDAQLQHINYEPFETAQVIGAYDVALVSPPFWNVETYASDSTQSIIAHPTFDRWFESFLMVSLRKVWDALTLEGHLILHLGDTREVSLAERTNLLLAGFPGAVYEGVIGVRGATYRDNEGVTRGGLARPVWVYRKTAQIRSTISLVPSTTGGSGVVAQMVAETRPALAAEAYLPTTFTGAVATIDPTIQPTTQVRGQYGPTRNTGDNEPPRSTRRGNRRGR